MAMAPEVYRCEPYNDKADVFSFGVVRVQSSIFGRGPSALVMQHSLLQQSALPRQAYPSCAAQAAS
jgi:hypothetical protein